MTRTATVWIALGTALALHAAAGCRSDVVVGFEGQQTSTGGTHDGGADGAFRDGSSTCSPAWCDSRHLYQCGDCWDNDGDGLVDSEDPDCLGPCQNTEESFAGAIPGQNHPACVQDCYFDQDSGSGNDGCSWTHSCDPLAIPPTYDPEGAQCPYPTDPTAQAACVAMQTQSAQCLGVCIPLTPNGCDCFGCCAIPGAPTPVWVGSADALGNPTCDMAHVSDPTRCRPCTQVPDCLNPCDHCEVCVGKTQLPADCPVVNGCPTPACGKARACSPCLPPCPAGEACITGCCVAPTGNRDQ